MEPDADNSKLEACKLWMSVDESGDKPVTLAIEDVDTRRGATGKEKAEVAMSVESLLARTVKAEMLYMKDQAEAVKDSMDYMLDESIKAELESKAEAPTHAKVPYTELTLAFIKPDALKHEREIRYAMHSHGFVIVHDAQVQLTKVRAALFYERLADKPWFEKLTRFMSSAPVHAFVLGKERAVRSWNVVIGPTDPEQARREAPLSLRARFGTDILRNAVHGSFNPARARQEIKLVFPNIVLDPLLDPPKARLYFDKHLKRTLIKGLTALAKAKPYSDPLKVIRWFAHWLQEHNPNRPYVDGKRHVEVIIPD